MILYRHYRLFTTGAITAAAKYVGDSFHVSFAECSPKDNFCKRTGRDLASARLSVSPSVILTSESLKSNLINQNILRKDSEAILKVTDFSTEYLFEQAVIEFLNI